MCVASAAALRNDSSFEIVVPTKVGPICLSISDWGHSTTDANGNANYTVQIRVWRETVPLSNGVDGTVLLLDGNTTVGSAVFTVLRLTNDTTVTVPVSCGGRGTISLVARVNEWDSAPLTVACAGKTGC